MPISESDTRIFSIPGSPDASVDFFLQVHERFRKAERNTDHTVEHDYLIGGLPVRLCFAGTALEEFIIPAFEHLPIPSEKSPLLTICLWDSISTGITMPPPPWSTDDYGDRSIVLGYNNDRIRTSFQIGSGILSIFDSKKNIAVWWIRDAARVPSYESGAPLQTILQWFMAIHNRQYVHAGAVGMIDGGVLLAGKGGSGKSTTASACLFSDLRYAGDDYVLVNMDYDVPTIHSLYNSAKLDDAILSRLPHLLSVTGDPPKRDRGKSLIFYHKYFPDRIIESFPIRAILLPHITHEKNTAIEEVTEAVALAALAPSTIFQLTSAGNDEFRRLGKFVRKVPAYALKLGTDLSGIPRAILPLLGKG